MKKGRRRERLEEGEQKKEKDRKPEIWNRIKEKIFPLYYILNTRSLLSFLSFPINYQLPTINCLSAFPYSLLPTPYPSARLAGGDVDCSLAGAGVAGGVLYGGCNDAGDSVREFPDVFCDEISAGAGEIKAV